SKAILENTPGSVSVVGIARYHTALKAASNFLRGYGKRSIAVHSSYRDVNRWKPLLPDKSVIGFLLDLGLSSVQLELTGRGFSYSDTKSLDMRFDRSASSSTAADLVNTLPETELANLIFQYGEERASRKIARAIVGRRKTSLFCNAYDLARVVSASYPSRHLKIHPATRTFQALRIAVNNELEILEKGLLAAENTLSNAGRLITISFHSLEDRIIKNYLKNRSGRCTCPPALPVCTCNSIQSFRNLTRRPVVPQPEELDNNPRSRSAKLRCAERVVNTGARV
ncbi:16S rRNA (cytosine(1402)-N(4))-methyltransferase RsmH, partial [bacterium]|nr:16S rRNA (cytosine(1402)-N(4))-methyltransferase RsmH [bacterium]